LQHLVGSSPPPPSFACSGAAIAITASQALASGDDTAFAAAIAKAEADCGEDAIASVSHTAL